MYIVKWIESIVELLSFGSTLIYSYSVKYMKSSAFELGLIRKLSKYNKGTAVRTGERGHVTFKVVYRLSHGQKQSSRGRIAISKKQSGDDKF